MFEKRKALSQINLLDCVPQTCFPWTENEEGLVTVQMPRFHVAWMQRYLVPSKKEPYIKIALDRFGSLAWKRIDGATTAGAIADAMVEEFGDEVQPIDERLASFYQLLKTRGFLKFTGPDGMPLK